MRDLPTSGRTYLVLVYLLGGVSVAWLSRSEPSIGPLTNAILMVLLGGLGAVCQIFVVQRRASHHSDHLTPCAFAGAFLLLPGALLIAATVLTFVPEWCWYRRKWYVQCFNIASWLIAFALGRVALDALARLPSPGSELVPASVALGVCLLVLVIQTALLAAVLWLARGQSPRASGLLAPAKLSVEATLVCMGVAFAAAWRLDPTYGLLSLLPLALIFQALHVPNLKEEATRDAKTGLANFLHFRVVLAQALEHGRRTGQPTALLMCDLDYLRSINNTHGHQMGDLVLQSIATILRDNLRAGDLAGRFGGEEFCVLLTDTDSEGGRVVAERIRRLVERAQFPLPANGKPVLATVSIGVAHAPEDGQSVDALVREADLAVYQAKRDGRNRVVVAGPTSRELAAEWARDNPTPASAMPTPASRSPDHLLRRLIGQATRRDHLAETVQGPTTERSGEVPAAARVAEPRSPEPPAGRLAASVVGLLVLAGLVADAQLSRPATVGVLGLLAVAAIVALPRLVDRWIWPESAGFRLPITGARFVPHCKRTLSRLLTARRDDAGDVAHELQDATLLALCRALDARDQETEEHSRRVQRYALLLGRRLGVRAGDLVDLARGALLHDIGKIGVPDAILRKPGRLTEAERRQMQRHPEIGYRVIADIPSFAQAAEIVLHHHEFYDGRGYPNGLAGDDIPLGARIFAVADALDAMTCDRPYRRAMSRAQALAEIARCRGSQFDPRVVDALLSMSEGEVFGPSLVAPATIPLDAVTAPLEPALRA